MVVRLPSELNRESDGRQSEREERGKDESTASIKVKASGSEFFILEPGWD